ncbi:hypothetical protein N665_0768s0010 [Sinapis alba]|nr:hypothetical protein N665_0768s0010 [Sinapis alba]
MGAKDLADTILRHPNDDEYDLIGSRGDAFLKYRPLNTRENKVFGFSISLQNCLPSIAVLKSVRSLKPKLPSSLGIHNLVHDFQCSPLVLPPGLHQNLATSLVSFFVTVFGIRKHDIT